MTTINLLPWREAQRLKQKKHLLILCLGAIAIAILLNGIWFSLLQGRINHQLDRNSILDAEAKQAESIIGQKKKLETTKQELGSQMTTLVELHNQRFKIVELLDALPKILPNSTHVININVDKNNIELIGIAPSNIQISEFMKQLSQQAGWQKAQLKEIIAAPEDPDKAQFRITLSLG